MAGCIAWWWVDVIERPTRSCGDNVGDERKAKKPDLCIGDCELHGVHWGFSKGSVSDVSIAYPPSDLLAQEVIACGEAEYQYL